MVPRVRVYCLSSAFVVSEPILYSGLGPALSIYETQIRNPPRPVVTNGRRDLTNTSTGNDARWFPDKHLSQRPMEQSDVRGRGAPFHLRLSHGPLHGLG